MSNFEKYLQESYGKHNPKEIEELVLDEIWVNKISFTDDEKTCLEKYTNLIHLSLNNLGLKTLKNFPSIKNLYYLSIKNNEFTGDDFEEIPKLYPRLNKLKISGNSIEKIDNLRNLRNLKLRKIEVKENPFSIDKKNYIKNVFEIIPSLEIVDEKTKSGDEVDTTDYHQSDEESGEKDDEYEEEENENVEEDEEDEDEEGDD